MVKSTEYNKNMILQIRTKDNLETLLQQGKSASWIIAEWRVKEIKKVEIYQFDGKRVLKAEFDSEKSTWTESNRLIVAFNGGIIKEADMDWNGQNPIQYQNEHFNTPKSETTNNELNNSFNIQISIPTSDLQKIEHLYKNNDSSLSAFLKELCDKHSFEYGGLIYSSSYSDIFDALSQTSNHFPLVQTETSIVLEEIRRSSDSENEKWHKAIQSISFALGSHGGKLISTLTPTGGSDFCFLAFSESAYVTAITILYHFNETINNASGWYGDFIMDYEKSYAEFLEQHNKLPNSTIKSLEFELNDGPFGITCNSNVSVLNIDSEIHHAALTGMLLAKPYC
jgi:hypothetical protein